MRSSGFPSCAEDDRKPLGARFPRLIVDTVVPSCLA